MPGAYGNFIGGGTMSKIWAVIQGCGALVGLATGAFVVWDRVIKEWPVAFIVREPLMPGSINTVSKLRIINRSQRPLLVWWRAGENSNEFRIARDDSVREIVTSLLPGEPKHIVDGNETVDLELLKPGRMDEIALDNIIETRIHWAFVQPAIWQRRRTIPVRITKKAYLALLGEGEQE